MKKVLIPTKLDPVAREVLEAHGGYEVVQDESTGLGELAAAHEDTYALIVRSETGQPSVLRAEQKQDQKAWHKAPASAWLRAASKAARQKARTQGLST